MEQAKIDSIIADAMWSCMPQTDGMTVDDKQAILIDARSTISKLHHEFEHHHEQDEGIDTLGDVQEQIEGVRDLIALLSR